VYTNCNTFARTIFIDLKWFVIIGDLRIDIEREAITKDYKALVLWQQAMELVMVICQVTPGPKVLSLGDFSGW
jgi:hypothetical protein